MSSAPQRWRKLINVPRAGGLNALTGFQDETGSSSVILCYVQELGGEVKVHCYSMSTELVNCLGN